jgi:acyl-CoA synthetase (AMP-forming)/AMP-acid ligase II
MSQDLEMPLTIPAALSRAARRFGAHAAYIEGGRRSGGTVTWNELWSRAEAVAAGLIRLGLNHGDRVAICAENSIGWVVAYYATVTAGASAALVYFDLKPDEIREQVCRPGSRFVFASEGVLPGWATPDLPSSA